MTDILLNFTGLIIGLCTFIIIGLFHPVVIKCHYYFGTRCWWWFLVIGVVCCALSIAIESVMWSTILGVTAFSSFWTIKEIFEQEQRVAKGWFPDNPARKNRKTADSEAKYNLGD